MNNFPKPEMDSMGGLEVFYFLPVESVSSMPDPVDAVIDTPIPIKPGAIWLIGYAAIDSLKLVEKSKVNSQGELINSEIVGFTPDSVEFHKLFTKMARRKFIVRAKDNDGNTRVVGTLDQPVEFVTDFDSQTVSREKGHYFSFAGELSVRSPYYMPPMSIGDLDSIYDDVRVREYDANGFPLITDYYYHENLLYTINTSWNSSGIKTSRKVVDNKSFL